MSGVAVRGAMSGVAWATSLALTGDFFGCACQARLVQDQATTFDVVRALSDRRLRGLPSPQALCPAGTAPPLPRQRVGEQRLRRMGAPRRRRPVTKQTNPPETTLAAHVPAASAFLPRSPHHILPTPMDCGRRTNPDQVHAQARRASLTGMAGELRRVLTSRLGRYAGPSMIARPIPENAPTVCRWEAIPTLCAIA
jgi:hypothetical protein